MVMGFPSGSVGKELPADTENWDSISAEDSLEKRMVTHCSILDEEFHGQKI